MCYAQCTTVKTAWRSLLFFCSASDGQDTSAMHMLTPARHSAVLKPVGARQQQKTTHDATKQQTQHSHCSMQLSSKLLLTVLIKCKRCWGVRARCLPPSPLTHSPHHYYTPLPQSPLSSNRSPLPSNRSPLPRAPLPDLPRTLPWSVHVCVFNFCKRVMLNALMREP